MPRTVGVLNAFEAQSKHCVCAFSDAYLPRTHSVHDVMNGSAVYVPATQSAQSVPPATTSYFPGPHAAQTEAALAAALHAAAGELRARAQAEHRRLGCRRGLEELLRFCWRARHVAWHVAHTTRLQCALQRRRNDRALGRALRHWWRVASVSARDGLRAECGQRGDTTPLTRPHRPPLAPLASAQHNVPLALKKTVPGPRRPVRKKVVVPGTPHGDGREMLYVDEGLSDLHPPAHRPTAPTQSPLCRPSQIPVFPKSTVRV